VPEPVVRLPLSYVLPLRRRAVTDDDLAPYVRSLAGVVEVIVVDGSDDDVFPAHRAAFGPAVRHVPVDADLRGRYGKVNGVVTGVRAASHERIVVADDDVRYGEAELDRMASLLESADVVRPQNHFDPCPWHARWDTARTLLNRAFAADYPGTLGVRRSTLLEAGGYDGDCLFENLELIRTVEAVGGTVRHAPDLYVRRLPPTARHFWSQRVRQAYDSFAVPARLAGELTLLPTMVVAVARRRARSLGVGAGLSVAVAEAGRRRYGGARVFPATASVMAPVWIAERAVCAWLAVVSRVVLGGVPYAGTVLSRSANSRRELRRRHGDGRGRAGALRRKDLAARAVTAVHVAAYRATGGRVAGRLGGMPVLLLTTRGRRTGRRRTVPLTYFEDGDAVVLVASYAGDDHDPGWYRNLLADPEVEVTRGRAHEAMEARPGTDGDKARLWPRIISTYDGYRRYQERTERDIPLAVLTPR
jgi:deazaflavin-dependent oxidoreductase (nitroreductase family)